MILKLPSIVNPTNVNFNINKELLDRIKLAAIHRSFVNANNGNASIALTWNDLAREVLAAAFPVGVSADKLPLTIGGKRKRKFKFKGAK